MKEAIHIESALDAFQNTWEGKRRRNDFKRKEDERIMEGKSKALTPVRALLKSLIDANVIVRSRFCWDRFSNGKKESTLKHKEDLEDKPLAVFESSSSPSWSPGVSLILEHPARIEIAIPNQRDSYKLGAIIIRSSTEHPDAHILHRRFSSIEEGCNALAEFIAENTVSVYGESVEYLEDEDYMVDGLGDF
jgi:effector-binding domain-containing protein